MLNKKNTRILIGTLSISVILFIALVVHIAIVTNPKDKPHYGIQLSRIDFNTKMDTSAANEINAYVRSIKGVTATMFSFENNNLVYAHQLDIVSGQEVYEKLQAAKQIDAKRYSVSAAEMDKLAKCPVMSEHSILKSLAHSIQVHFL